MFPARDEGILSLPTDSYAASLQQEGLLEPVTGPLSPLGPVCRLGFRHPEIKDSRGDAVFSLESLQNRTIVMFSLDYLCQTPHGD